MYTKANLPSLSAAMLTAALLLSSVVPAHAQDKATLDLLVKRGLLSQADVDGLAKSTAVPVVAKNPAVQKIQLEGLLHFQFDSLSTQDQTLNGANPPSTNQFILRRVYFGALADWGNGWGSELLMDFASGTANSAPPQSLPYRNLFFRVVGWKTFDSVGTLTAGYQKVNFINEENTSVSIIKPVDRSLATNYFTGAYGGPVTGRLGFGNQHMGVYWNGDISLVPGAFYGAGLSNGVESTVGYNNPGGFNKLAGWLNAGYKNNLGGLKYIAAVNFGYSTDGNSNSSTPTGAAITNTYPAITAQSNTIWGYNPYVTLDYGNFEISAEFMQAIVQNGRVAGGTIAAPGPTSTAAPYGFNVTPSYKINDQWELVTRLSYLNTNGRGTSIGAVETNGGSTNGAVSNYDSAWALYAGFNYYIIGNAVKFTAGYEYARFSDRQTAFGGSFRGPRADVNAVRARLQLLF